MQECFAEQIDAIFKYTFRALSPGEVVKFTYIVERIVERKRRLIAQSAEEESPNKQKHDDGAGESRLCTRVG